ncbi:MAG: GlsB/YeaQ/YmgE family stress response membrane protein [Cytophagales bacterium]
MEPILTTLTVGLLAGWLAGFFLKGKGYGILINLVLGVIGGFIGHFVMGIVGINSSHIAGNIIISTIGAIILVWIIGLLGKKLK